MRRRLKDREPFVFIFGVGILWAVYSLLVFYLDSQVAGARGGGAVPVLRRGGDDGDSLCVARCIGRGPQAGRLNKSADSSRGYTVARVSALVDARGRGLDDCVLTFVRGLRAGGDDGGCGFVAGGGRAGLDG